MRSRLALTAALLAGFAAATTAEADGTYHPLANGSFQQNWSDTGLITTNDDWSGVPSLIGYRGDDNAANVDPRQNLAFVASEIDVNANNTDPESGTTASSGGIYEVESGGQSGGNPTIAFQGSNTADAPFVLLHLNATGCTNLQLAFTWRDLDNAAATASTLQQVVAQARSGTTGNFAVIADTYRANANIGSDIPISVALPSSLDNQAEVQIRWMTTNAGGTDAMIGIDDIQVQGSCSGGVDNPPVVNSTTPADGATGVDPGANVVIQFSEAVTTQADWFTLNCSSSGAVAVSESGMGSSRTLNPVPLLAFGEQCTGSIDASKVIDLDGTPDPMAANFSFSFTVVADDPPSVVSTFPANGVSGVPVIANLLVTFSEPVTVAGSWFAIQCANSGAVGATVSGGPTVYTLDPAVNFDFLEQCTVTLDAASILDLDGNQDPLAGGNYAWSFTTAASASNYYASVDPTNATTLRNTLHVLIDDHIAYPYTGNGPCNAAAPSPTTCDTWDILESADENPANPGEIIDIYQNDNHPKVTAGNSNYNREHTWPNSLGFPDTTVNGQPNPPYTDTHMLYLSDPTYNGNRGNKPYDNCPGCGSEDTTVANNGVGGQGGSPFPGDSNWWDGSRYQVWAHRKGDAARAIFYMDVRYEGGVNALGQSEPDLVVTDNLTQVGTGQPFMGKLCTLYQWHFDDPPDAGEIIRNEVVFGFQANRNPFIDHPEWVQTLWGAQCGAAPWDGFANGFE